MISAPTDTSPTKLKINIILSHSDDRVTVGIYCVLTDAYNFNKRGVQKMSRILVVDDEARIRQIIRKYGQLEVVNMSFICLLGQE